MRWSIVVPCQNGRVRRKIYFKMRLYHLSKAGEEYFGTVSEKNLRKIFEICKKYHLQYRINDNFSARSNDYRSIFFKNNTPSFRNMYFCSYCGRLIGKDKVTVDHLYPVGAVKKSISLQKKLRKKGIGNVNDCKNLVPACKKCNQRKSAKLGVWIIKGQIGRIQWLWKIRHVLRLLCFCVILYVFCTRDTKTIINVLTTIIFKTGRNFIWNLKQLFLQYLPYL